nr:terminase small subunit protein [Caballeronia zhejiangensis]
MPDQTTVYRWLREREDFRQQYARAREDQAEHYLDEIIAISDDSSRDTIHGEDRDIPNSEWIARSRLRVDARKWAMSKLAPKKYGDKLDVTSGGESLNLTPEQRQSKMDAIAAAAAKRKLEAEQADGSDLV